VLIILALVGLLYIDQADLGDGFKQLVRTCLAFAPILMPLGFFLSVVSPRAERPNRMILFTYAGAVLLAVGTLTLGVGLLLA
jgi:cell division protein FtsW (lipid II flippase)